MRLARPRRRYGCEINITPLIDIVFLLIIFAMVVSQFTRLQAENVSLPEARKGRAPTTAPAARVVVNVLDDGRMVAYGREHTAESLEALLADAAGRAGPAGVSVVIRGDRQAQWARVSAILRACAARGIEQVKVAVVAPGGGGGGP
ncbi:MAG TPA: biopolymer transporter ExbD [Phycisphaerae bacterium]|nr:biopolymer transporter ExbD [Phycisphaerae bacterium]